MVGDDQPRLGDTGPARGSCGGCWNSPAHEDVGPYPGRKALTGSGEPSRGAGLGAGGVQWGWWKLLAGGLIPPGVS